MMTNAIETSDMGKRLLDLREARGWLQPELGKQNGTSGAIVGRYERGDIMPSIDVARKLADAFDVTLDYLAGGGEIPEALQDKDMVERWEALHTLPGSYQ